MTPVGETLRRERLKRNLDFEHISSELKISTRFLEAIENDQYDRLPGGVFAKSFVRQYARLLGLDEEELAGQVQSAMAPSPEPPQFSEKSRHSFVPPIQVPRVEEWETVGDRGFHWSGPLSAGIMVVVVMLVCSAVYTWIQRPRSQAASPAPARVQTTPAPDPAPAQTVVQPPAAVPAPGETVPSPVAAEQPPVPTPAESTTPVAPTPVSSTPANAPPANPEATVHVQVTADEPVWILARTDGKYAFSGTLSAGETRMVDGVKDVVLRLGNAGNVNISLNGKPLGAVGPKGQTRTVQFTSGGFQIVPAKPSAAVPLDPLDRL
jgi:cytoskeleton protein RodZ